MFERHFTLQGFQAVLTVQNKPGLNQLMLTVLPFATDFHAPKAELNIELKPGDVSPRYTNHMRLTSSKLENHEINAFIKASQVAAEQIEQWTALAKSLESASDAAYTITRLAEQQRWEDVMLFIALLPNPLAPLSDRCNYRRQDTASNVAAAIFRHDAFGVAKATFLRYLDPDLDIELKSMNQEAQNMIRSLMTLLSRIPKAHQQLIVGAKIAALLLERDDIPNYTDELMNFTPQFSTDAENGTLISGGCNPLSTDELCAWLQANRPTLGEPTEKGDAMVALEAHPRFLS